MWRLLIIACAGVFGLSPARADGPPAELPIVADVAAFSALPPMPAGDGLTVRVGLLAARPALGPWVTVCCEVATAGPPTTRPSTGYGAPLGPLSVDAQWDGRTGARHLDSERQIGAADHVFACVVPLTRAGTLTVTVYRPDGRPLAARSTDVTQPAAWPWQEFCRVDWRDRAGVHFVAAVHDVFAGYPPAAVPADAGGPSLRLALRGDTFAIDADGFTMTDWADLYLLARWWVNGRSIEPAKLANARERAIGRLVGQTKAFRVRANLPDDLGELKAGDRIGLQVMYAGTMYEDLTEPAPLTMLAQAMPGTSDRIVVSNRIDFDVTPAMLASRATDATRPEHHGASAAK